MAYGKGTLRFSDIVKSWATSKYTGRTAWLVGEEERKARMGMWMEGKLGEGGDAKLTFLWSVGRQGTPLNRCSMFKSWERAQTTHNEPRGSPQGPICVLVGSAALPDQCTTHNTRTKHVSVHDTSLSLISYNNRPRQRTRRVLQGSFGTSPGDLESHIHLRKRVGDCLVLSKSVSRSPSSR